MMVGPVTIRGGIREWGISYDGLISRSDITKLELKIRIHALAKCQSQLCLKSAVVIQAV